MGAFYFNIKQQLQLCGIARNELRVGLLVLFRYDGKAFIHTSSTLCPLAAQVAAKTKARLIAAFIKLNL